ncbi:protein FAM240A-like [Protobothrops mucrosquamatus]|uniref:protein FAM240A-like n=1 Tax=Protobothrops mucrosquamatus TaxID=103944 RepID=UPI0010FB1907|nr:protein FAM240A-like [Protobothrops mucrosquamatus]
MIKNMDIFTGSNHHPIVICDAHGLKKFWEKIIETYTKQKEDEDSRLHQSALNKLRHEWTLRLENQIKILQKNSENGKVQDNLSPVENFSQNG